MGKVSPLHSLPTFVVLRAAGELEHCGAAFELEVVSFNLSARRCAVDRKGGTKCSIGPSQRVLYQYLPRSIFGIINGQSCLWLRKLWNIEEAPLFIVQLDRGGYLCRFLSPVRGRSKGFAVEIVFGAVGSRESLCYIFKKLNSPKPYLSYS